MQKNNVPEKLRNKFCNLEAKFAYARDDGSVFK